MGNLISHAKSHSKSHPEITDTDRAVLSLKAQRRKLEDQSKLIEKRIDQNVAAARELVAANKPDRALLALKKKKINEHQLKSISAWLFNVEDMLSSMEITKQQHRILAALKDGTAALKAAQEEWTLEDVTNLMDETAEAKEHQDKINNIIATQLDDSDNEAVAAELKAMEEAVLGTHEQQVQQELDALPEAPTHEVEQPERVAAGAGVAAEEGREAEVEQQREAPLLAA